MVTEIVSLSSCTRLISSVNSLLNSAKLDSHPSSNFMPSKSAQLEQTLPEVSQFITLAF